MGRWASRRNLIDVVVYTACRHTLFQELAFNGSNTPYSIHPASGEHWPLSGARRVTPQVDRFVSEKVMNQNLFQ